MSILVRLIYFFFNDTATTEIYTLSLHDALPILEEGGDDVKSSWPLRVGLHTCYNGVYRGKRCREAEQISQSTSKSGLESATRLHEVGIASNRESECRGEYVPGPCTHRPSHHGSGLYQK